MGKRIGIVLALLLTAGIWCLLFSLRSAQKASIQHYASLQQQAEPLENQVEQLQHELERTKLDYQKQMRGTSTLELLMVDLDEALYTEAYPKMKHYNYAGMLLLGDQWPGDEGCITEEQFRELLEAGWGYTVCWQPDEGWYEDTARHLEQLGLEMPQSVYFPKEEYSEAFVKQDKQFSIYIHHGEEGMPLMVTDGGDRKWFPGAKEWNYSGVRNDLSKMIDAAGNRIYEVSFQEEGTAAFQEKEFGNMLRNLDSYVIDKKLEVLTLDDAWLIRKTADGKTREVTEEMEGVLADYQSQMDELNKQIDAIYDGQGE